VEHALARHTDAIGEQAVIIAHSRGGQFARPVAVRRPELVRGLITLGSPLTRLPGARPPVLLKVLGLGVVGSLGVPGLLRVSCLWGECCRPLRNDLMDLFPSDVPFLSVFSRHDEVVPWESSLDPAARHREICPPIMASSQARWRSNYWPKNSRYKRISALTDLLTLVPLSSTSKFIQQVRKSRAFRGGCA
jgi:pimeloyl-ACP methyl ester carboxylesterase